MLPFVTRVKPSMHESLITSAAPYSMFNWDVWFLVESAPSRFSQKMLFRISLVTTPWDSNPPVAVRAKLSVIVQLMMRTYPGLFVVPNVLMAPATCEERFLKNKQFSKVTVDLSNSATP